MRMHGRSFSLHTSKEGNCDFIYFTHSIESLSFVAVKELSGES